MAFALFATFTFAQSQTVQTSAIEQKLVLENDIYKLFPTQNYWTFLKLDTRNGKIWQVHFTINEAGMDGELVLNSESLVSKKDEINGRFTLYPTENMFNFLMLDQINGYVYQVQWSLETYNRGIMLIN